MKTKILAFFLCIAAAPFLHANDLSLSPQGGGFRFATYSPSSATLQPTRPGIEQGNDEVSVKEFDVWERIRQGFAIADLDNRRVAPNRNWYVARPDYIQRTTERGSRYLFYIVQELEARGMPTEIALLPFIESAFNPHANSHAKAVGIWQFIPGTGRKFNLNQSSLKDERRDVLASTEAALNYLQKLYNVFGDWQIALAAYNCGEGNVQKAIRKTRAAGKPITFNNLSARMPRETRDYVPKLQAVKDIVSNPAKYGITLPKVQNQPFFVTIHKTQDMDVPIAATLAEMPLDDFRALNPQFGRHVITGGSQTIILLPRENVEKFKSNLQDWQQANKPLSSWTTYTVTKPREKLEDVAAKFKTTADILREVNHVPAKMLVKQGSTLLVPKTNRVSSQDIAPELVESATIATVYDGPPSKKIKVKVRRGDSLHSLSKRYHVSAAQIKQWNHLKSNRLRPGSRLVIYAPVKATKQRKRSKRKVTLLNSKKNMVALQGAKRESKQTG